MSLIGGLLNRIASLAEATRTPLGESSAKASRAASALTPQQVVAPAVRVATVVAVILAGLAGTADTPQKLPDAALGSERMALRSTSVTELLSTSHWLGKLVLDPLVQIAPPSCKSNWQMTPVALADRPSR